jgi:hypothetical protein
MIPVVVDQSAAPCALPSPDSWRWFTETGRSIAPSWKNEVTLRSVEMFTEYEPGSYVRFISPTPLLMVVALGDVLTVSELALAALSGHFRQSSWSRSKAGTSTLTSVSSGRRHRPPPSGSASISYRSGRVHAARTHATGSGPTLPIAPLLVMPMRAK